MIAFAIALTAFLSCVNSRDADGADAEDDAPPKAAPAGAPVENVENSLFGKSSLAAIPAVRTHLDQVLQRRLESARNIWHLNPQQLQKLELAGRGDIARLFAVIEKHRQKLSDARQGVNDVYLDNPLNRQTNAVRSKLRAGPFDEDSLFAKSLRGLLTPQQIMELDHRPLLAAKSREKISLANAAHVLRTDKIKKSVYRFAWNRDGTQLALVEFRNQVAIYEFPELRLLRTLAEADAPVDFDFGPSDNLVAIGKDPHGAVILDSVARTQIQLATGNPQPHVEFSPAGDTLVTGGYGKSAKLWSVATGELIKELAVSGTEGALTTVFSPDGAMLAVGNRNSTTHLFDVASGKLLQVFPKASSHDLRFDPNGDTLAVTYVDGSLVLWDTRNGKSRNQVQALANELYTVDWSPDGSLLATAGYNAPVTLWSASDLSVLNELESPEWVFRVRFSRGGTRLVFAGNPLVRTDDKFVEIWAVP